MLRLLDTRSSVTTDKHFGCFGTGWSSRERERGGTRRARMGCCLSKPDVLGASQSGAAPAKAQKGSVVDGEAQADKAEAGKTVKAIDGLAGAAAGAVAGGEEAMADAEEFADAQSAADVDDDFKSAGAESLSSVSCLSYQIESLQPSTPSARKNLDFPSPSAQPSGGEKAAEGGIAGEDGKGVVVAVGEGEGGEETGKEVQRGWEKGDKAQAGAEEAEETAAAEVSGEEKAAAAAASMGCLSAVVPADGVTMNCLSGGDRRDGRADEGRSMWAGMALWGKKEGGAGKGEDGATKESAAAKDGEEVGAKAEGELAEAGEGGGEATCFPKLRRKSGKAAGSSGHVADEEKLADAGGDARGEGQAEAMGEEQAGQSVRRRVFGEDIPVHPNVALNAFMKARESRQAPRPPATPRPLLPPFPPHFSHPAPLTRSPPSPARRPLPTARIVLVPSPPALLPTPSAFTSRAPGMAMGKAAEAQGRAEAMEDQGAEAAQEGGGAEQRAEQQGEVERREQQGAEGDAVGGCEAAAEEDEEEEFLSVGSGEDAHSLGSAPSPTASPSQPPAPSSPPSLSPAALATPLAAKLPHELPPVQELDEETEAGPGDGSSTPPAAPDTPPLAPPPPAASQLTPTIAPLASTPASASSACALPAVLPPAAVLPGNAASEGAVAAMVGEADGSAALPAAAQDAGHNSPAHSSALPPAAAALAASAAVTAMTTTLEPLLPATTDVPPQPAALTKPAASISEPVVPADAAAPPDLSTLPSSTGAHTAPSAASSLPSLIPIKIRPFSLSLSTSSSAAAPAPPSPSPSPRPPSAPPAHRLVSFLRRPSSPGRHAPPRRSSDASASTAAAAAATAVFHAEGGGAERKGADKGSSGSATVPHAVPMSPLRPPPLRTGSSVLQRCNSLQLSAMSPLGANSPGLFLSASVRSTSRKPLAGQLPRLSPSEYAAHLEAEATAAAASSVGQGGSDAGSWQGEGGVSFAQGGQADSHSCTHFWTPVAPSCFHVRGPDYFSTACERAAHPVAPYVVTAVDVFRAPTKLTHVARLVHLPGPLSSFPHAHASSAAPSPAAFALPPHASDASNAAPSAADSAGGSSAVGSALSAREVAALVSAWPPYLVINIQAPMQLARQPHAHEAVEAPPAVAQGGRAEGVSVVLYAQICTDFFLSAPPNMLPLLQGMARGFMAEGVGGSVPFRERVKLTLVKRAQPHAGHGQRAGERVGESAGEGGGESVGEGDGGKAREGVAEESGVEEGDARGKEAAVKAEEGTAEGGSDGSSGAGDESASLLVHPCQMFFRVTLSDPPALLLTLRVSSGACVTLGPDYLEVDVDLHRVPDDRRHPLLGVLAGLPTHHVDIAIATALPGDCPALAALCHSPSPRMCPSSSLTPCLCTPLASHASQPGAPSTGRGVRAPWQGNNEWEVPEPVVACARLGHIDADLLTTLRHMP
ncbi:unnamed protein product [Closterium sp. Naga37s-1]|nr:unnamed protein product [Closterium sp. Naga37s-1]